MAQPAPPAMALGSKLNLFCDLINFIVDLSTYKWGYGLFAPWASFLSIFSFLRPSILISGSGTGSKVKLHCMYCNKSGHVESVCFTKKKTNNTSNKTTPTDHASATFTFTSVNEQSKNKHNENDNCYFVVDCGATCHIINEESLFTSYDDTFEPKRHFIELAGGLRSNELAVARGNAELTLIYSRGNTANVISKDALLAPNFPVSLFSVRAATDAGAKVAFRKGAAELIAKDTYFKLVRRSQFYFLPTNAVTSAHTTTLNELHQDT